MNDSTPPGGTSNKQRPRFSELEERLLRERTPEEQAQIDRMEEWYEENHPTFGWSGDTLPE